MKRIILSIAIIIVCLIGVILSMYNTNVYAEKRKNQMLDIIHDTQAMKNTARYEHYLETNE